MMIKPDSPLRQFLSRRWRDLNRLFNKHSKGLRSFDHESGATVITRTDFNADELQFCFVFHSGHADCPPGLEELAHLAEHQVLNQPGLNNIELIDHIEDLGGKFGASTYRDHTVFMEAFPGRLGVMRSLCGCSPGF